MQAVSPYRKQICRLPGACIVTLAVAGCAVLLCILATLIHFWVAGTQPGSASDLSSGMLVVDRDITNRCMQAG